jgi:signal recognition particle subunit SRP54
MGSGTDIIEVNRLIKQFEETSKMMRMMTTGGAKKMMQMMSQLRSRK